VYAARLLAFTRKRLPNGLKAVVDTEEIVQETFLTYFRGIQSGHLTTHESGDQWPLLAAICRRKLLEHLQWHGRIKRDTRGQVHFSNMEDDSGDAFQIAHREHTASREFRIGEVHRRARDLLTARQREINDARMDGLSDQELQERFGCTERTIRRAITRFRQLLEQELQQSAPHFVTKQASDVKSNDALRDD
jgi:RNA polymerase sigma factor (sigma-70 family)